MNQIGKSLVTQQTVADAAGVHYSTVSLALRNDPRLPSGTREKIHTVARQLGYTPNPLVSLLMARVRRGDPDYRGTRAYVHTHTASQHHGMAVNRKFLGGATRRAGELGYKLDEFFLPKDRQAAAGVTRVLKARNINGVIVEHTPSPACPDRCLPFDLSPFAAVSIGVPVAQPPMHYVANDQYMRPIVAARELLALGYRRPGLVMQEPFDVNMAHRCTAGFWAVQQYVGELASIPILRLPRGDEVKPLRRWLARHRPDVVLGTRMNVVELLRETGSLVPAEVGWVHLDWLPEFAPSSGVYGNSEHTGGAAVEMLVSHIHHGERGPPQRPASYFVPGTWVPGRTVRRVGPALDLNQTFFAEISIM